MNEVWLRRKLEEFLLEDLGPVEVDPEGSPVVRMSVIAESVGVFAGGKFLEKIFTLLAPDESFRPEKIFLLPEGKVFSPGDALAEFRINAEVLRVGIRTALNLLAHLSGIATATRKTVKSLSGAPVKLLDTRKTTPGLRVFEKYAVRVGGGANHRFGRYDGILIKKEDIKIDGGITPALNRAFAGKPHLTEVEIEVETLAELDEVLRDGRVRYILLDNMEIETMREAVEICGKTHVLEASGVGEKDLREVAATGVHCISLSSLAIASRIKMKMRIC